MALGSASGAGHPAVHGLVLPASGAFAIGYVHTVYRAPSAELFTLRDGRLTMHAIVSTSGGVLDYYAVEGTRSRTREGGWLLRLAAPATYDELSLLATPLGRRTLLAGGRCLPLHPAEGAAQVRLAAGLTQRDRGGPCPPPYNQSLFVSFSVGIDRACGSSPSMGSTVRSASGSVTHCPARNAA